MQRPIDVDLPHKLGRDEARRRIEYELDLEEASLANRRETYGGWL